MKKTLIGVLCILFLSSLCIAITGCGGSTSKSEYSEGLEFTVNADGKTCSVAGIGTCKDTDIVIPATSPEGYAVTCIDSYAFYRCSELTSIVIPDSVTSIGDMAFDACINLKNIYHTGTTDMWNNISIGLYNECLTDATMYYYSEAEPALNADGTAYDGNFWHYDSDGKTPVIWKK